ncbi:Aste57867_660 [Aphanomyces stellatus]|uniref:Aste57867_660 protein n=1 Tax=Aphanomyces stellatus TaxID=120398 RepID=A0A485K7A4_9STRA|nr:hypothetical protein As57867_000659 [Aphanomyces stellatus]VFT77885.1 Aste57867_660 [Aphanomyces stellatus]
MEWEARTNQQGYTYYYHLPTGAMQWTPPDDMSEAQAIDVSANLIVAESDSSSDDGDGGEDDDNDGDARPKNDATRSSLAPLVELAAAPDDLNRIVLDTVVWFLREVWQSHVEIGSFVVQSTRTLLSAVTPQLQQLLVRRRALPIHPQPSIPTSFIPAKTSSSVVAVDSDDDDETTVQQEGRI